MTIRRFIPEAADRKALGHLEVCIDDLKALIDLLQTRHDVTDIVVEFEGGEFTDPSELKQLSNSELRELRIKAGDLVVTLSASRAEAIGRRELTEFVRDGWARSRHQAKMPPPNTTWISRNLTYAILYGGWSGLAIFLIVQILVNPEDFSGWPPAVSIPAIVLLFGGMIIFMIRNVKAVRQHLSWAVIHPMTAHELRTRQASHTTVPLWSLIVAIAAFVASTILGILSYIDALGRP
jgi:hypothetical protein